MNFRRKISNLKNRDKRCFLKNEQKHTSHKIITEVLISVSLKSRGRGEIDTENIFEKDNVPKFPKLGETYKVADSRNSVNHKQNRCKEKRAQMLKFKLLKAKKEKENIFKSS